MSPATIVLSPLLFLLSLRISLSWNPCASVKLPSSICPTSVSRFQLLKIKPLHKTVAPPTPVCLFSTPPLSAVKGNVMLALDKPCGTKKEATRMNRRRWRRVWAEMGCEDLGKMCTIKNSTVKDLNNIASPCLDLSHVSFSLPGLYL